MRLRAICGRKLAAVAVLLGVSSFGPGAATALGAYAHPEAATSFGTNGTSSTSIVPESLAYNQANKRLYALAMTAPRKVHGFTFSAPGVFTPLGGSFPLSVNGGLGDPDLSVDNTVGSTANNIYYAADGPETWGYGPTGTALAGFPIDRSSEVCGVAVDNQGDVWLGNYGASNAEEFSPSGIPLSSVETSAQGNPCHLEFDRSTNDLYVSLYGGNTWRYTAASGYSPASAVSFPTGGNSKLAINASAGKLYAASTKVRAFDTATGALLEEFGTGTIRGIAVDDATDTVFISNATAGKIEEWRGVIVPDVTTGDPVGNSSVSGSLGLAGAGPITECYFEFGTSTSYGSKEFCSPATPYASAQNVTANLPGLIGETTYHYRLVAKNANGRSVGADNTIVPHNVDALLTDPATNVQRTSATLNAHFNGTGMDTDYYFEWGKSGFGFETKSATPPGADAGVTVGNTPLSFNATNLQAGTLYNYRVVAQNSLGVSVGNTRQFTTPPAVQSLSTDAATNVGAKGASLNASYVGDGDGTSYYFEYGKTTIYGSSTAVQNAGPAVGATSLPATVSGLDVETTYHYRVVATNSLGTTKGSDQTFTTTPAVPGLVTTAATDISQSGVTLNGEFTGNGYDTSYYFEWGPSTAYGQKTATPPGKSVGPTVGVTPVSATLTDFKGYFIYHFRVVATNEFGTSYGNDQTVVTLPGNVPGLDGSSAVDIAPNSARIEARIAPNRSKTKHWVEYGKSSAYGLSTPPRAIPSFEDLPQTVSTALTELTPGTTYHYRVVASNLTGMIEGSDQTFSTPGRPAIEKLAASGLTRRSVRIETSVDPNSSATKVRVEYGKSRAYGQATAEMPIGSATSAQAVGFELSDLAPGTTYHFRITAENGMGTTKSVDQTLKTAGKAPTRCRKAGSKKRGKCVKKKAARKKGRR